MKLGFASADKPQWPKVAWYVEAAQNLGHDVHQSKDWSQLPALLADCDLVIFGQKDLGGHWPCIARALQQRTCPIVYLWFDLLATQPDLPIHEQPIFQTYERMFLASESVIVKERSLLRQYRDHSVNAFWCDQGCPSDYPAVDHSVEPEWDLLVWGQGGGHYRERQQAVEAAVSAGFKVAWAGTSPVPRGVVSLPWTHPLELPRLASRARCVLSVGRRNDLDGYWSDGLWLALGMGACVIRRETPGLPDGPYWRFADHQRLIEHLTWARRYPQTAIELGQAARQWVMDNHTIERRVNDILRIAALTAAEPDTSTCGSTAGSRNAAASA